jgi:hypothetical protein
MRLKVRPAGHDDHTPEINVVIDEADPYGG